jgi:hypothetical protein
MNAHCAKLSASGEIVIPSATGAGVVTKYFHMVASAQKERFSPGVVVCTQGHKNGYVVRGAF